MYFSVHNAGFAFSPAPWRGKPISGAKLLGAPLPEGSTLAEALSPTLASAPPEQDPAGPNNTSGEAGELCGRRVAALSMAAGPRETPSSVACSDASPGPIDQVHDDSQGSKLLQAELRVAEQRGHPSMHGPGRKGMFGESYPSLWRDPRLFILASGHGSPCLDLRRVSSDVADAAAGTDLVVIEGMGRSVHTNWRTLFKCDALKLSMIKNQHLAEKLFGGNTYVEGGWAGPTCVPCKLAPLAQH